MAKLVALFFLLSCSPIDALAQNRGDAPQLSARELAEASAACDQLAGMPNPPMSVAACKAMIVMSTSLTAGAADPSAQRPGDEAMTCAAIFAELKTMAGVGISDINTARAESDVRDGSAMAGRQAGELNAFIAESYALVAAAGLVGAFTPNFGRGDRCRMAGAGGCARHQTDGRAGAASATRERDHSGRRERVEPVDERESSIRKARSARDEQAVRTTSRSAQITGRSRVTFDARAMRVPC